MKIKKYISCFICIIILLSNYTFATENEIQTKDINKKQIELSINLTRDFLIKNLNKSDIENSQWIILGLSRLDKNIPKEMEKAYVDNLKERLIKSDGVLENRKYTQYSKEILTLSSLGYDVSNIEGYNLLSNLSDYDKVTFQGLNGSIWALIALDSAKYEIPTLNAKGTQTTRENLITYILNRQLLDSGYRLNARNENESCTPDITAMAVQALSKYLFRDDVKKSVEKTINCLSSIQNNSGGYSLFGVETSESASQVIVALTSLKIDPGKDKRFIKSGHSVIENLLSYQNADGSFRHTKDDKNANMMATEQGFYALVSYKRYLDSLTPLYDMSDVKIKKTYENKEKNKIDKKYFDDIENSKYKDEINKLYQEDVISGVSKKEFAPKKNITRAQFATIISKALNLKSSGDMPFNDVKKKSWYYEYVLSCYKNNIIKGMTKDNFYPQKAINKQEAASIIYLAAKYKNKDTNLNKQQIRDYLAQFEDYTKSDKWARKALAYSVKIGAISNDDISLNSKENIDRQTMAHMVYCLLNN